VEHGGIVKGYTRDIAAVAVLEAEETGAGGVSAQVASGTVLSSITENGSGTGKVDKVAMLEPEQVTR